MMMLLRRSFPLLSLCIAFSVSPVRASSEESIVLAGGCFWGMEAVFEHVKGVTKVMPGYAGGAAETAQYEVVSTGTTGHAESVQVTYDPEKISLDKLLNVYFIAAHNPTELNRQTPDVGTQYRSTVFYATSEQKQVTENVIKTLQQEHAYSKPIVTTLEPLKHFYPAEEYHRNYATLHPDNGYIVTYDLPRVENVKKDFPTLYVTE